jgi:predicted transcriptional regulator
MAYTIELTPEMQTRLEREAARRGQEPSAIVAEALETLWAERNESADATFADMRGMSRTTLHEYWDNDEDAIYDTL